MIEFHLEKTPEMTYAEAVMYCFSLGDGWRLPTVEEYNKKTYNKKTKLIYGSFSTLTWVLDDPFRESNLKCYVIPVRELCLNFIEKNQKK